jgi:predicted NAD-dependent protein-ADP-ribosyltransferase YbiA (DUF1768 family)
MSDVTGDAWLTQDHLEMAKKVIESFDEVLVLEDGDQSNLFKLWRLFGDYGRHKNKSIREHALKMPSVSNNELKNNPMYEQLRVTIDAMRRKFEHENQLDIEVRLNN